MKIKEIEVEKLNPAEYNPRKISTRDMNKLKKGITEFGLVQPIVINSDMTIIGGHQRVAACRELGILKVPCIILDIEKSKEKALNLALNKISGEWDRAQMKELLLEIDTGEFDINLSGFDELDMKDLFKELENIEETSNEPEDSEGKPHKCICPDCGKEFYV